MLRTPIATIALALSVGAFAVAQVVPEQGRSPVPGGAPTAPPQRSLFGLRPAASPAPAPGAAQAPAAVPSRLSLTPTPTSGGPAPANTMSAAPEDQRTFQSGAVLPEPADPEQIEQPTVNLPTTPIEPYLLRRQNGPFMVLAKTFRGPDAARYAQALAMELRSKHQLPAYVWWLRLQPGHSNIRNVPPTAPGYIQSGETVQGPERVRSYDEAAVLVGDCQTIDESEDLLHTVKKLDSEVLDGTPSLWNWKWRKDLHRAMLTTNPLRGSEELYPVKDVDGHTVAHGAPVPGAGIPVHGSPMTAQAGQAIDPYVLTAGFQNKEKSDPLVKRMNNPRANARSLYNCTGPYALQVAEFFGRATTNQNDPRFLGEDMLKRSPLAVAGEEAERLAESLAKCKSLPPGLKPFVFHDRAASRVFIGPFQRPDDPNIPAIINTLNQNVSLELLQRQFTQLPLAPARQLSPVPTD